MATTVKYDPTVSAKILPGNARIKRENDEKRIAELAKTIHPHLYSFDEWIEWTGNNYIKSYYDVMFPDGTIFFHAYPNAGALHVGQYRLTKADNLKVRLSVGRPY